MKILLTASFFLLSLSLHSQEDILIKDAYSNEPISFATVSFGDGLGTFADGKGIFKFSKKIYPKVDTLYLSSVGYQDLKVPTNELETYIDLVPQASRLTTIVVSADLMGKFKKEEVKTLSHKEYEDCWLPTVESEIAVKFDRVDSLPTMISKIKLPILLEKSQKSKKGKKRRFSTLFRIQFYDVQEDGSPAYQSYFPSKTFIITQESDKIYELDITDLRIVIPKTGIFAAIQVLGYTKPNGDLINAKKYREIRTRTGFTKVSTSYRPLLPFTDRVKHKKTYVRRIFFDNKKWQLYDLDFNPMSKLVRNGHVDYGMGADLRVYPPQN